MSNLDIALDNVDAAFREGIKAGITVKKEGEYRHSTAESYKSAVKTMIRDLARDIGEDSKRLLPKYMNGKTWDGYFEKLADRYEQGTLSSGEIQKRVHGLEAFRTMVKKTNVLGKNQTIRVGDKEERLDYLKERGVVRSLDEVKAIKPSNLETNLVHSNINTSTLSGKIALDINKLQTFSGARIKSTFKLEVRDINFSKMTITFRNDKNNFTRTVPMTKQAKEILTPYCSGKSAGSPVFTLKNQKGNDMSIKNSVKTVQKYTNDAAKKAGVNRENRRYTTHSNRKNYAQNLYNSTRFMSKSDLKKAISKYVNLQGSNKDQIRTRIKTELERINAYRKSKGMMKNGFSHEHLRRLYVSLHLGHSRTDIILRYVKPDKKK